MIKFFKKSVFIFLIMVLFSVCFTGCSGNKFTVTFKLNGGYLIYGNLTQEVANASEIKVPEIARVGYNNTQGGYNWDTVIDAITKSTTITAIWYVNDYVLHYENEVDYNWKGQDGKTEQKRQVFVISSNNIKTPYGKRIGANLARVSADINKDLGFGNWYFEFKDKTTVVIDSNTIINEQFFMEHGYTESEALAFRGTTLSIKLKYIEQYTRTW